MDGIEQARLYAADIMTLSKDVIDADKFAPFARAAADKLCRVSPEITEGWRADRTYGNSVPAGDADCFFRAVAYLASSRWITLPRASGSEVVRRLKIAVIELAFQNRDVALSAEEWEIEAWNVAYECPSAIIAHNDYESDPVYLDGATPRKDTLDGFTV